MERVGRTYVIRYDMSDEQRKTLSAVYSQLPQFCGYADDGTPMWYGRNESGPYLFASVEPSGLLVEGVLDIQTWVHWDTEFRRHASRVLGFEVKDADE